MPCVNCSSVLISETEGEWTSVRCSRQTGSTGGISYCGCECANCCGTPTYTEISRSLAGTCYTSIQEKYLVACNFQLSFFINLPEFEVYDVFNWDIRSENFSDYYLTAHGEAGKSVVGDGCLGCTCEKIDDAYKLWRQDYIDNSVDSFDGDKAAFQAALEEAIPESSLPYICCTELQLLLTASSCCLLSPLGAFNTSEFLILGNGTANLSITPLTQPGLCLASDQPQDETNTLYPDCVINFCVSINRLVYGGTPPPDPTDLIEEVCYVTKTMSTSGGTTLPQSFIDNFQNCDQITLNGPQVNCTGEMCTGSDPTNFTFYSTEAMTERIVQFTEICPPVASYWSGTITPEDFEEISSLSDHQNLHEGFLKFNNNETKKINKIYASKKNNCKKNVTFKVQEWNNLEKSKKTFLKIKHGKLYCLFKITENIIEKEDRYEFTVKHIYGKIPQDNTLLVIDFIEPPKTTSSLNKVDRMEILKRIRKTKI